MARLFLSDFPEVCAVKIYIFKLIKKRFRRFMLVRINGSYIISDTQWKLGDYKQDRVSQKNCIPDKCCLRAF